jgi:hypothetical protein
VRVAVIRPRLSERSSAPISDGPLSATSSERSSPVPAQIGGFARHKRSSRAGEFIERPPRNLSACRTCELRADP